MSLENSPPAQDETQDGSRIEYIVQSFEQAWRLGERPAIEAYCPVGEAGFSLLIELVHVELDPNQAKSPLQMA